MITFTAFETPGRVVRSAHRELLAESAFCDPKDPTLRVTQTYLPKDANVREYGLHIVKVLGHIRASGEGLHIMLLFILVNLAQGTGTGFTQGSGPFRILVAKELRVVASIVRHREVAAVKPRDPASRRRAGGEPSFWLVVRVPGSRGRVALRSMHRRPVRRTCSISEYLAIADVQLRQLLPLAVFPGGDALRGIHRFWAARQVLAGPLHAAPDGSSSDLS